MQYVNRRLHRLSGPIFHRYSEIETVLSLDERCHASLRFPSTRDNSIKLPMSERLTSDGRLLIGSPTLKRPRVSRGF